jgi:hypothetical protein
MWFNLEQTDICCDIPDGAQVCCLPVQGPVHGGKSSQGLAAGPFGWHGQPQTE